MRALLAPVGTFRPTPRVIRVACLVYLFVAAFPGRSIPASTNLDGSWVLELNRLAERRAFGPDFAFTYGPLSYLLHPALVGTHPQQAALFRFVVAGVLVALTAVWARSASPWRLVAFAAACALGTGVGFVFEYQLVLAFVLLGCVACEVRPPWLVLTIAGLSAVAMFLKLTLGIAGLAVAAAVLAARLAIHRRSTWRDWPGACAVFVLAFAATASQTLGSVANAGPWLSIGFELASAFSEVMSLDARVSGEALHLTLAAAVVVAFAVGAVVWWWRRTPALLVPLVAAGSVFLAFKHGFVRRGFAHTEMFFPFLLALLSAALLRATSRRALLGLSVAVLVTSGLSVQAATVYGVMAEPPSPVASLVGARGGSAIYRWSRAGTDDGWIQVSLRRYAVPGLREAASGAGLGVFPFELAICGANDVDCTPTPALQTYAAYTARLDRLTAQHYASARAPGLLYAWFEGIDGRSPILDTPATWREIRWRYALAPEQPGPRVLLVRAREGAAPPLRESGAFTVREASWNEIPPSTRGRHLAIELELTAWGKIRKLFYRIPQVVLVLKYSDGREVPVRIVPDTARNGLPLDEALVTGPDDLVRLLGGARLAAEPVAFGLAGEGLDFYCRPVRGRWLE